MHNLFYRLSYFTIVAAFFLLVWLFYTILYPFEAVRLNVSPVKIMTPVVYRGEQVEIELDFTKLMNIKPTVTYYLIDGEVSELAGSSIMRPVGNNNVVSHKLIPMSAEPGPHKIQIDLVYEVAPWRKLYYSWETEYFEVR